MIIYQSTKLGFMNDIIEGSIEQKIEQLIFEKMNLMFVSCAADGDQKTIKIVNGFRSSEAPAGRFDTLCDRFRLSQ